MSMSHEAELRRAARQPIESPHPSSLPDLHYTPAAVRKAERTCRPRSGNPNKRRNSRPVSDFRSRDSHRRTCRHHPAAFVTAAGTEIDYVVGVGDEFEVVLDHDQRVALGDQPGETLTALISVELSPVVGSSSRTSAADACRPRLPAWVRDRPAEIARA